jgi:hypothetical protein
MVRKYRHHKNCTVTSLPQITKLLKERSASRQSHSLLAGTAFRYDVHLSTCNRTKTDRQLSIWLYKEKERGTEQAYSSQNSCNFIMGQCLGKAGTAMQSCVASRDSSYKQNVYSSFLDGAKTERWSKSTNFLWNYYKSLPTTAVLLSDPAVNVHYARFLALAASPMRSPFLWDMAPRH